MKKLKISLNGKNFDVELLSKRNAELSFSVNGVLYTAGVEPVFQERSSILSTHTTAVPARKVEISTVETPGELRAPMPGVIISLNVQEGDRVEAGQTLCVIEAMKMENNLSAPISGVISKIHVKNGDEVQGSALLIKINTN